MAESPSNTYNHKKIESNWKENWYTDNIYKAVDFSEKPKKYILAELPYPSGEYLHVGHMMRYTVPEVYSRYLRMQGYNVMYPMGWDCFGLPAETFAIKKGITPQEAIATATKNYKKAMQDMGYAIDWDREINTSDPEYYKWTQWMFIKLWEAGLAKQKEMPVWWCKELGVLADEEVLPDPDGPTGKKSERDGYPVERKLFRQWVLDIPAYADRLVEDLDIVDYTDSVKLGQINWIGKKEGANITFEVDGEDIEVFTTRPDTIFGVTFLAISPEHTIAQKLAQGAENTDEVLEYINRAKDMTDLERQTKDKTGVKLEGIFARHPLDPKVTSIPVFVADYILADYGTGSIMGVPAHDERDMEFAERYSIDVISVIDENNKVINSQNYNGMTAEDFMNTITERLEMEGKGKKSFNYKIREQVFSRQRYWGEPIPLVYKDDGRIEKVPEDELPLELPVMKDFVSEDGISPLAKNEEWINTTDSDGNSAQREADTMPTWAGSNWYYIRYIDPKNNRVFADIDKMRYWMPVDKYFGDAGHTTAHLIYSRFWYKFLYDQGYTPHPEPYKWRMSGGLLLGQDNKKMSKSRPEFMVDPKDVLVKYGADAARVYLSFIGPYEETYPWNDNGLKACYKLIKTIHDMKDKVSAEAQTEKHVTKKLHQLIKNTTQMIEDLKMNTAVSEIMIFVNVLKETDEIATDVWKDFIKVIAPFAPFVAEELWHEVNGHEVWMAENSVHLQAWPTFSEDLAVDDVIELPVQINGKLRATLSVGRDLSEDEVKILVMGDAKVKQQLEGIEIKKLIYVPNRVVNLVV